MIPIELVIKICTHLPISSIDDGIFNMFSKSEKIQYMLKYTINDTMPHIEMYRFFKNYFKIDIFSIGGIDYKSIDENLVTNEFLDECPRFCVTTMCMEKNKEDLYYKFKRHLSSYKMLNHCDIMKSWSGKLTKFLLSLTYNNALMYRHINFSESFIEYAAESIDWANASMWCKLSEDFIEKHSDNVCWFYISNNQKLSLPFIEKHIDKISFDSISYSQRLSLDFIIKYIEKLDFRGLMLSQRITRNHIDRFPEFLKSPQLPKKLRYMMKYYPRFGK